MGGRYTCHVVRDEAAPVGWRIRHLHLVGLWETGDLTLRETRDQRVASGSGRRPAG